MWLYVYQACMAEVAMFARAARRRCCRRRPTSFPGPSPLSKWRAPFWKRRWPWERGWSSTETVRAGELYRQPCWPWKKKKCLGFIISMRSFLLFSNFYRHGASQPALWAGEAPLKKIFFYLTRTFQHWVNLHQNNCCFPNWLYVTRITKEITRVVRGYRFG